MALTRASTGLTPQQWDAKFFKEYVQENVFKPYMGTDINSIIQVKRDLTSMKGKTVTFALVNRLKGAGVTGDTDLEGNEESLSSRSYTLSVQLRRNAVLVPKQQEQYSAISLRDAGREVLMDWMLEDTRDHIITKLGEIDGVNYASATAAQRNTWLTNNQDRVLYGNQVGNSSSLVHATALANIDSTNDKITSKSINLMKRMALDASPKIRPVRVSKDKRRYVLFVGSRLFRDLKDDATLMQAQREALPREKDNILFVGGDLMWDNVVIHEIDDIPVYTGVGASSIDVSPAYFCGAQALGYAVAQDLSTVAEERDYKSKQGVAVEIMDGFGKMRFGTDASSETTTPKDNGMLTAFFAATPDA
jgi:N4-gp56 family major capsid protein